MHKNCQCVSLGSFSPLFSELCGVFLCIHACLAPNDTGMQSTFSVLIGFGHAVLHCYNRDRFAGFCDPRTCPTQGCFVTCCGQTLTLTCAVGLRATAEFLLLWASLTSSCMRDLWISTSRCSAWFRTWLTAESNDFARIRIVLAWRYITEICRLRLVERFLLHIFGLHYGEMKTAVVMPISCVHPCCSFNFCHPVNHKLSSRCTSPHTIIRVHSSCRCECHTCVSTTAPYVTVVFAVWGGHRREV